MREQHITLYKWYCTLKVAAEESKSPENLQSEVLYLHITGLCIPETYDIVGGYSQCKILDISTKLRQVIRGCLLRSPEKQMKNIHLHARLIINWYSFSADKYQYKYTMIQVGITICPFNQNLLTSYMTILHLHCSQNASYHKTYTRRL